MDVTFLEFENFYPSPVPNSPLQGETQVEVSNWLMANGTGNKEVEQHEAPPESEPIELRNEAANVEPKNTEYPQSPHSSVPEGPPPPENVPEVNCSGAPYPARPV